MSAGSRKAPRAKRYRCSSWGVRALRKRWRKSAYSASPPTEAMMLMTAGRIFGVRGALVLEISGVERARLALSLLVVAKRAHDADEIAAQLPHELALARLGLPAEARGGRPDAMADEGLEARPNGLRDHPVDEPE